MTLFQRIAHRLFGWHYIAFMFGWNEAYCRVRCDPNGVRFVKYCGHTFTLDETGRLYEAGAKIGKYRPCTWQFANE